MGQLVAAELIFRRGTPPDATYLFKHALVRDAAYESLLKATRIALHARLLDVAGGSALGINLVLYHGVLAPHAGWRARVVAYGAPPVEAPVGASASRTGMTTRPRRRSPGTRR